VLVRLEHRSRLCLHVPIPIGGVDYILDHLPLRPLYPLPHRLPTVWYLFVVPPLVDLQRHIYEGLPTTTKNSLRTTTCTCREAAAKETPAKKYLQRNACKETPTKKHLQRTCEETPAKKKRRPKGARCIFTAAPPTITPLRRNTYKRIHIHKQIPTKRHLCG
jgi:hypothetical protein